MKRNIFDLCTDSKDCYLAVIEVRELRINSGLSSCGLGVMLLCFFRDDPGVPTAQLVSQALTVF